MLKLEIIEKEKLPEYFSETLPLYLQRPSAGTTGFPSPADDYLEAALDLNKYLQVDKSSVFLARACGESMVGAGIEDGDLLIIDRALKPQSNDIVICTLNGELVVKRYFKNEKGTYLMSDNPKYLPLLMEDGHELLIWGVCINVVKELKKRRKNVRSRGL